MAKNVTRVMRASRAEWSASERSVRYPVASPTESFRTTRRRAVASETTVTLLFSACSVMII